MSVFVMINLAFGTTAPDGSLTVPTIVPSWADATKAKVIRKRKIAASREILRGGGWNGKVRAGIGLESGHNFVLWYILSNLMQTI